MLIIKNSSRIILVSGFLGSGKTTYLLARARALMEAGVKCAVIVNEVGEVGVDQIQYEKGGLQVSEIFGGCICCSLTVNLKYTIEKLTKEFGIEKILIEPSGVADVRTIIQTLTKIGFSRGEIENVMVLDCLRLRMLWEAVGPLTQATIKAADKIVISKADIAAPGQVEQAKELVRENRTDITPEVHI